MADREGLVSRFREVTGAEEERAKFYLESANWNMDAAMTSFYEGEEDGAVPMMEPAAVPVAPPPVAAAVSAGGRAAPAGKREGGLFTLSSLRSQDTDSDSDSDQNKQAFYAGGSESSGQQVLGPAAGKSRDQMIADMFKKARELGAEEAPQYFKKKAESKSSFGGQGYKLGDAATPAAASSSSSSAAAGGEDQVQEVVLALWGDGFTVDNGPLRSYEEPENMQFMKTVMRGEVPAELRAKLKKGYEVSLSIQDRRAEDYTPPKSATRAFQGQGNMLGSPTPTVVTSPAPESDRKKTEEEAKKGIGLKEGEPTTNIQIRLTDGSRLTAQFNHTHTVGHVYDFVNRARPEYAAATYSLTLFPNRELTKKEETLKDANVLSSALIMKLK